MSGRTAHDLAGRVPEGTPQADPDSALAFSMEGAPGMDAPPALRTAYTRPGLHSASAAPLTAAGDAPGAFVLGGVTGPRPKTEAEPEGEGLTFLPLHEPFAGDEIGRHADLLAARCPPPVVAINPEDAARLGLDAGAHVELDGHAAPVPLTLDRAVPKGHLAASAGRVLPRAAGARIRVTRQHWEER